MRESRITTAAFAIAAMLLYGRNRWTTVNSAMKLSTE
jgi:hypothetical protein